MAPKSLFEVLYIDRRRVADLATQITGTPAVATTKGEFGGELSLTPKISSKLSEEFRRRTVPEQVQEVERFLEKKNQLQHGRPKSDLAIKPPWVTEIARGRRISVPAKPPDGGDTPAFSFWLCPPASSGDTGMLCLLEDFGLEDAAPTSFREASTYTLLQSLVYFTRSRLRNSILHGVIPDAPHPNPYASFAGKPASLAEFHNIKEFCYEFVADPFPLLDGWGCKVSSERAIRTVYRIREIGGDAAHSWRKVTVFGYPLWIVSADSDAPAA